MVVAAAGGGGAAAGGGQRRGRAGPGPQRGHGAGQLRGLAPRPRPPAPAPPLARHRAPRHQPASRRGPASPCMQPRTGLAPCSLLLWPPRMCVTLALAAPHLMSHAKESNKTLLRPSLTYKIVGNQLGLWTSSWYSSSCLLSQRTLTPLFHSTNNGASCCGSWSCARLAEAAGLA